MKTPKLQFNKKHNIISLDKIELNKPYTFSYNPNKQYMGKVARLSLITDEFKKLFYNRDGYEYEVYFELSPKGRWHCHGIIYFKSYPLLLYMDRMDNITSLCTLEIDSIKDIAVWDEYMTKQVPMMSSLGDYKEWTYVKTKDYNPRTTKMH